MPGFLDKSEETTEEVVETPDMIKVGEDEYSQDDLQKLVGLGKIGQEAEEKFNTSIDKVWPEFSKKSNRLKEVETELEELRSKPVETPEVSIDDEVTTRKAQEAARKLGIVLKDDQQNLVTTDKFREMYLQERAAERLVDQSTKLETDIDGTDGRPKFDKQEILEYMQNTGINDPQTAYNIKYQSKVDEWRANQILKNKKPGMVTTDVATGVGAKQPEQVKVTNDNLEQMMSEALQG